MRRIAAESNNGVDHAGKFQALLQALDVEVDAAELRCTNDDVDFMAVMLTAAKRVDRQGSAIADLEGRDCAHIALPPARTATYRLGQDEFFIAAKSARRRSLPRIAAACAALTMGLLAAIGAIGTANVAAEDRGAATQRR